MIFTIQVDRIILYIKFCVYITYHLIHGEKLQNLCIIFSEDLWSYDLVTIAVSTMMSAL